MEIKITSDLEEALKLHVQNFMSLIENPFTLKKVLKDPKFKPILDIPFEMGGGEVAVQCVIEQMAFFLLTKQGYQRRITILNSFFEILLRTINKQ
jgi:hypothetical protein